MKVSERRQLGCASISARAARRTKRMGLEQTGRHFFIAEIGFKNSPFGLNSPVAKQPHKEPNNATNSATHPIQLSV
jgi:hypothetical protein